MKKITILALLCTALLACDARKEALPEQQGPPTSAAYRQETLVKASDTELHLTVREVRDSRCPMDVVCITMGKVEVDFAISDGTQETSVTASLQGDDGKSGRAGFRLGNQDYLLTIREVLPYPKSTEKPDLADYKVSVYIGKK